MGWYGWAAVGVLIPLVSVPSIVTEGVVMTRDAVQQIHRFGCGVVLVSHLAVRPGWRCDDCGRPWPCQSKRYRLIAEFQGTPMSLYLYMGTRLVEAAGELTKVSGGELYARFVGWIAAHNPETRPDHGARRNVVSRP